MRGKKAGMTLLEVLVVVIGLLVFVALCSPRLPTGASDSAKRTRMLSNGRGIYQSILAAQLEDSGSDRQELWPIGENTLPEKTSTAYFHRLMHQELIHQDYSLYAAPGVSIARSLDEFTAQHNAWSVVTGVKFEREAKADPFLISRNLNESALVDWAEDEGRDLANIGHRGVQSEFLTPFDDHCLVVIRIGGGGEVIPKNHFYWRNLNPSSLKNPILNP
jgi:hypothetical protein